MKKNSVFKEIIFALLLCLLILLVLALILYNYVPANKTLPDKISYTTPTSISRELASGAGEDEERVILTYEVDATDMNNYEDTNNYNPGKPDPFRRFEILEDGTIVTNPEGIDLTDVHNASDLANKQAGGTGNAAAASGSTSSNGGTSSNGTSSSGTSGSTNNGSTGASSSTGNSNAGGTGTTDNSSTSNNGGKPGYYNYKNGK